jgi:uridine kinase
VISLRELVERLVHTAPRLIGIDGLPCSGKSTVAQHLCATLGAQCVALDDFVLPERLWPSRDTPAFPFQYIRYDEFLSVVRGLAAGRTCTFLPYNWRSDELASPRTVDCAAAVIVEGVSALNPQIAHLYDVRLFVQSDHASSCEAAIGRSGGKWADYWKTLFMPSVDLYMLSSPEKRADLIVAGRGAMAGAQR